MPIPRCNRKITPKSKSTRNYLLKAIRQQREGRRRSRKTHVAIRSRLPILIRRRDELLIDSKRAVEGRSLDDPSINGATESRDQNISYRLQVGQSLHDGIPSPFDSIPIEEDRISGRRLSLSRRETHQANQTKAQLGSAAGASRR